MDIILKYTLKKIQEQTSKIPDLNYGGCCYFTKLLAKQLELRNIKYKVSLFDSYLDLNKEVKTIRKKSYPCGAAHVSLKIDKYYVDGILTSSNPKEIVKNLDSCNEFINRNLSYKDLQYYSTHTDWNQRFNKRKYHPIINKIIINQFKIYDKLKNDN